MNSEPKKKRAPNRPALILDCAYCGTKVKKLQSQLQKRPFCNLSCAGKFYGKQTRERSIKGINHPCTYCGSIVFKKQSELIDYYTKKSKHPFCSRECSGKWCVENKIGIHADNYVNQSLRSQLEEYIERRLLDYFSYFKIYFNDRVVCSPYELDFYFPDLKLAIELNGIHHYEPIFGEEHLAIIKDHDLWKIKICNEKQIRLEIIDNLEKFSESFGEKIWNDRIKPILLSLIPYCENKK